MNENKNFLIPNPKSIICIGLNYADHIAETSLATHDFPEIFMKTSNALAGNHDTITIEDETFHYDYEGELVIIIGKSLDNFAPIGPNIVSSDDFDFESATITTTVNGEIRQQAKLEQMIFKPYNIIAFLSTYMTLQEGDIIFTGTPSGVVLGKNESKYSWLKPGDIVTVSISGIGTLENKFI